MPWLRSAAPELNGVYKEIMYPYSFTVSLRITHPSFDPDLFTEKLGMEPEFKWKAGDDRATPKGRPLDGKYDISYWTSRLHKEDKLYSEDMFLEDYLERSVANLTKHSNFFREIIFSNGTIEYFIGVFADKNFGFEYPSSLLKSLGELSINFALDIYPEKE